MTYGYDALNRRIRVTHPRTGTSLTHYDDKGRVDYTEDTMGHRTHILYDPLTGHQWRTIDPSNQTVDIHVDLRGQVTNQTGTATYPVTYVFDSYGQMIEMRTHRTDDNWDTTRWCHDPATGLLTNKQDDAGLGATYTYTPDGRLATRTWARGAVTRYTYHASGVLTNVAYATPDTADSTYAVDRLGRQTCISDAFGTRHFQYDPTHLHLTNEILNGLYTNALSEGSMKYLSLPLFPKEYGLDVKQENADKDLILGDNYVNMLCRNNRVHTGLSGQEADDYGLNPELRKKDVNCVVIHHKTLALQCAKACSHSRTKKITSTRKFTKGQLFWSPLYTLKIKLDEKVNPRYKFISGKGLDYDSSNESKMMKFSCVCQYTGGYFDKSVHVRSGVQLAPTSCAYFMWGNLDLGNKFLVFIQDGNIQYSHVLLINTPPMAE